MFRYQKGKVRVMGLLCRILVAVTIYRYDAVGILIYHSSLGIHTEGAHVILVFFRTIHDLTLIEFICKIRKDLSRQFNPDTQIHTVGIRWISRSLHTFCIHLLPLRPAEMIHFVPSKAVSSL